MNNYKIALKALIVLFSAHLTAAEQLYKWVDEKGKVHYSDKPPQTQQYKEQKVVSEYDLPKAPLLKPLAADVSKNTLQVPVAFTPQLFSDEIIKKNKVGFYFFGKDCVSPTRMTMENINKYGKHSGFIPSALPMSGVVATAFQKQRFLGYGQSYNGALQEAGRGLTILVAEIKDLKLHACHTKPYNRKKGPIAGRNPSQLKMSKFKTKRVYLKIHWKLLKGKHLSVVEQFETEGSVEQWKEEKYPTNSINLALERASNNLLANKEFVKYLYGTEKIQRPTQEPSLLDKVTFKPYRDRSKVANALSYMASLKPLLIEYYLSNERWPDVDDVSRMISSNTSHYDIESLDIGSDGSITAHLTIFDGSVLTLTPDVRANNVIWHCNTNIHKSSLPSGLNCNGGR